MVVIYHLRNMMNNLNIISNYKTYKIVGNKYSSLCKQLNMIYLFTQLIGMSLVKLK